MNAHLSAAFRALQVSTVRDEQMRCHMLPATLCVIMARYVWCARLGRVTVLEHEVALEEDRQPVAAPLLGARSGWAALAAVRRQCCPLQRLDVTRSWTIAFYKQVADPS